MDVIVTWSGWGVAIGMAVWKIIETVRNRPNIKVTVTITDKVVTIEATNCGQRPINLTEAGLRYANGLGVAFPTLSPGFPYWLYSKKGYAVDFDIDLVRKELKQYDTVIQFAYFTDETGRRYKSKIPKTWEQLIHGTNS